MISTWKRKNALITNKIMGSINDTPELIKKIVSMVPVVGIAFQTAEMHKISIQLLAEQAYKEGTLNPASKLAWEKYLKACETEHAMYDNFCQSFIEHVKTVKKSPVKGF